MVIVMLLTTRSALIIACEGTWDRRAHQYMCSREPELRHTGLKSKDIRFLVRRGVWLDTRRVFLKTHSSQDIQFSEIRGICLNPSMSEPEFPVQQSGATDM